MLVVEVGNEHAIEGNRNNPEGALVFEAMPAAKRVTTIQIPDDEIDGDEGELLTTTVSTVVGALKHHIAPEQKPSWIATSDTALRDALLQHYELPATAGEKPKTWPAA